MKQRGENHGHRAANASDYLATGKLRCPRCGKAMIGTRATGKTKTYRYYTCWTLQRYGTQACAMPRLNANDLDHALLDATSSFYRTQHDVITQAVETAQHHHHHANHNTRTDELATTNAELTKATAKIDRYLDAFENGTLDAEDVKDRPDTLRQTQRQLRDRKSVLDHAIAHQPTTPDPATLTQVAHHIGEIVRSGHVNEQKSLIETLVAHITISGNDRITPTFRVPQPAPPTENNKKAKTDLTDSTPGVHAPTHLVELRGIEPLTPALQRQCSTN
jgi:site-specific DNA recombinase